MSPTASKKKRNKTVRTQILVPTTCNSGIDSAYFINCSKEPSPLTTCMYQHTTCKDSPVTGLSVCPSGRGAFGSGLVAAEKYRYSVC